uniref:F-box domain-containing protein n=1 Tax=Chenopodium quinoa TaxID=63459 RepID=A0A803LEI5_CHEQI
MDLSSNEKPPYSTTIWNIRKSSGNLLADRLSVLPDELLIQILSLLPTTDAVVMSILSRKMRSVFPLITSLDFDDSPISYCLKHPNRIDRFPAFVSFVIKAIHTYQSEHLSRFRLRIGRDFVTRSFSGCTIEGTGPCDKCCFPDLKFPLLNILIGFPLSHHGLRELDLRIQVRKPGEDQLPSEIFTCDTLEALKLDVNLGLHQVFTMPFFHLPKLKLFHFTTSIVSEKDFLNKLVSSCPLLEDLTVQAWWKDFPFTTVSSPSLRRLCLKLYQRLTEENSNSLHINTPNLKSLDYYGNLAVHYDIQNMQRLVKADININNVGYTSVSQEVDDPLQRTLSLIRPLSIVQHLSLAGLYVQILDFYGVKDYLPVFRNLKYLELGYRQFYWDKVLLAFLNCSPVLETLVFPQVSSQKNCDKEIHGDRTGDKFDPVSAETCISIGGIGHIRIPIPLEDLASN